MVGYISSHAQSLYAYGLKPEEEAGRYHEAHDLIVRAWTDPNPFEWHGEYFNYKCVSILPRPYQQPHPPIWTTATSDQSIHWAAQHKISFIAAGPTAQCEQILNTYQSYAQAECGWTPSPANRGIFREILVSPTRAAYEEKFEEIAAQERENAWGADSTSASPYPRELQHPDLRELDRGRYEMKTYSWKKDGGRPDRGVGWGMKQIKSGHFLLGDPDSLIQQITEQKKQTNAGVLVIRPEMGNMPLKDVGDGMELFAKEVLPVVRKL